MSNQKTTTEIQGNRVFLVIHSDIDKGYVIKENGKDYKGKNYMYNRCPVCRKFTCHMMGGAKRHISACNRNKKFLEDEMQSLSVKNNWEGLSHNEFKIYDGLQRKYKELFGSEFIPEYYCPA